ncbi:MAG: aspartyl/glutamyl-tRNA amidotransferase subunit C [Candidatus Moranbacteria bacterium]|nr:aspartyl/glutamyl-tRNA amidotransferase subunit C [Candidatus Moranbacteria bacterium]
MNELKKQLEKSIKLAHLELERAEKNTLLNDLGNILNFVALVKKSQRRGEKMFGKNIAIWEKEFPQLKKADVTREDVIAPFEDGRAIINELPSKKDNLVKVKRV